MTWITVTFIRHGESEDNLKYVWAGWKDSPLSALGQKQASALGRHFSSTPITHIYASPLKRAHSTAQHVQENQSGQKPPLSLSPHLREQHFGIAEGYPWVLQPPEDVSSEDLYAQKIFPVLYGREEKFPEAESLDDLARRAEVGIRECVLPHVVALEEGKDSGQHSGVHVALASHGLCIGELVSALVRLDPEARKDQNHTGLMNTAWTRVKVRVREGHGKSTIDPVNPPPLEVKVTHVNDKEHLKALKEEDITPANVEVDGAKAEAKAFFGGEKVQNGGAI